MKKSIFMVALAALAMTSCSQDEVLEVKKDMITFGTYADNASRATITTTATIADFKVWGVVAEGNAFISYFRSDKRIFFY